MTRISAERREAAAGRADPSPTHPEHHSSGVSGEPDMLVVGRPAPRRRSPGRAGSNPRSPGSPGTPFALNSAEGA